MSTLVLIRHGETEMAGRFCGHSDPELNPAGEFQAARAAEQAALLGVRRICSSDLRRAAQTAGFLTRRIGVPVELRPDLREMNFGLWEGLGWRQIEALFPEEADRWLREFPLCSAPRGEAYAAFTARVETAIESLLRTPFAGAIAIVTHRGVMLHTLVRYLGFSNEEAWSRTGSYGAVVAAAAPSFGVEALI
ncbi:MAG: histidine phosphatase family protein [Terracidiphilus sp.]